MNGCCVPLPGARHVARQARNALLALALLAASTGCSKKPSLPIEPIGGDFTLTDHNGQRFELASQRGKVVLIFFGYSFCPDVCPTTLSKLTTVAQLLGEDRDKVKTLYITVDPERDTPDVLKLDLSNFNLDALGLTGSRGEIDPVVRLYGASYQIIPTPNSAAKYTVTHSTNLYALDRDGRVRLILKYEATADEIVQGIREILADAS
ncbi:MAG: SCO family protein [Gemmatimonadaceae bacterium]|nr:SCO family protein [Gemmatimonadaceae bacterium]